MSKNKTLKIINFFKDSIVERYSNNEIKQNASYINYIRKRKIEKKAILFESLHGTSFTGNVYALFKYIIENLPEYRCYVTINNENNLMIKWIKKNYSDKNIKIIKYQSKEYLKILATVKYLINDYTFLPYFYKRTDQIYLNMWCGLPLEFLKNNLEYNRDTEENIQKNLMATDKLVMSDKIATKRLIENNNLLGILNSEISFIGNGRIDLTLNSNKEEIYDKYQFEVNKKIVLYVSSLNKDNYKSADDYIKVLIEERNLIQRHLGDNYVVYIKNAYLDFQNPKLFEIKNYFIPNWSDINEILSVVDILITDHTNLTIDFIRLNKPIYFYVKDRASINFNMNIGINKLPGSISYNIEELLKNLNKPLSDYLSFYHSNIKKFINEYCSKDDGLSCSRITEFIFNNTSREKSLKSNKKVVLFYGGAFYNNGITSSIINLSKIFNYDKYELIIIKTNKSTPEKLNNIKRLDSRAHLITLFSDMNKSLRDTIDLKLFNRQGYNSKYVHKKRIVRLFKEYFQQTLGNIKPEVVIDYSGYNKLFSALFAFAPVKKNAIFLHNDMYEEYNKIIDGRYKHRWNLKVVFSLYNQYSKVVSVSDSANQANMYNLKKFVNSPENKMITIPNIIDGDYVIEKANSSNEFKLNEIYMYNKEYFNFITVARLSPEKNQINLIMAFKQLINSNKQCRLYILGEGPLYENLHKLIKNLGLENHVFLLGFISNPYVFMKQCDCFILPSNYEGQGISILEAKILNKPIIGTNVTGIKSVITSDSGILVENNIPSIVEGMNSYIEGNVPCKKFEYEKYNNEIMEKLEKLIL